VRPSTWWAGTALVTAMGAGLSLYAYLFDLPYALVRDGRDKAWHFALAGLLAYFLDGALRRRGVGPGRKIPLSALLVLVPAAVDECLQRYSAFRTASLLDFAADVVGVVIFTWLSRRSAL
jgi:polysaccharide biosynthesis protein VpsQ